MFVRDIKNILKEKYMILDSFQCRMLLLLLFLTDLGGGRISARIQSPFWLEVKSLGVNAARENKTESSPTPGISGAGVFLEGDLKWNPPKTDQIIKM